MTDDDFDRLALTLARHVDNLQRVANTWSDDYAEVYAEQESRIVALVESLFTALSQEGVLTASRLRMLAEFRRRIEAIRLDCYEEVLGMAEENAARLVANEQKFHVAWILLLLSMEEGARRRTPKAKDLTLGDINDLRRHGLYNGETLKGIYRKIADLDMDRIIGRTTRGLLSGNGLDATLADIRKAFATTRKQIAMNTAGVVNGISNDVSSVLARRNGSRIDGVMWVTALDEHVCDECAQYEGEVFKAGDEPACPVHVNCRCHLVPVTMEIAEAMEEDRI